ncbi:hypothetical protein diail_8392 [Diaporthe ilicicola]|nr:hypothetical protein diail_8392 [Diaporthe ilicicola]
MSELNQDDCDIRSIDTPMSSSYDGIETPNYIQYEKPLSTGYTPAVPCPGNTYKIHLRDTDKVITVTEGEVLLQSPSESQPGGGWYWICAEKGNWLGFRNHVSGNYLGHNGKTGVQATVKHHKSYEFFCVRHHPHGGYILLVKHPWAEEMWQIGCASDEKTLIGENKGGAQWEFEEV